MRKLTFSQRKGLKQVRNVMQIDSIDSELRASLWNALTMFYWDIMTHSYSVSSAELQAESDIHTLCRRIWISYFIRPLDNLPHNWADRYKAIREYFFGCLWNEAYDFIEFVANNFPASYPNENINENFMNYCNQILVSENSAYRFVNGRITQITSPLEISSIEEAIEANIFTPVHQHIETALKMFSDRKSPDYRNSIKESISAVEALCRFITGKPKASLGDALGLMKKQKEIKLHPTLEIAFDKLYGYTCNETGIRHSLFEEPNLGFGEAQFMLVACSAFVNYLISKSSKKN